MLRTLSKAVARPASSCLQRPLVASSFRRSVVLKGIPPLLSPDLLKTLAKMGHGDELVIADGNFPSESVGKSSQVVRADGHDTVTMLDAVLTLLPLDTFVEKPAAVMQIVGKPTADAPIFAEFQKVLDKHHGSRVNVEKVERFAFYERAKTAFAVVATSESRLYGNIIVKKGVIGK